MSRENPRRQIGDIAQATVKTGLYHGKLAENYDGIGQYVLVSLSQSSVAAAYKARVSAGDFGTGQFFPVGTPVSLSVYRGKIEVLSLGLKPSTTLIEAIIAAYACQPGSAGGPLLQGVNPLGQSPIAFGNYRPHGSLPNAPIGFPWWPAEINDGDDTTWSGGQQVELNPYWLVDFGSPRVVSGFRFAQQDPAQFGNNASTDWALQSVDDLTNQHVGFGSGNWVTHYRKSVNGVTPGFPENYTGGGRNLQRWGESYFAPHSARYWRLISVSAGGAGNSWDTADLELFGGGAGDGPADMVGTSIRLKRCDSSHIHMDDRAPTAGDDEGDLYHIRDEWIQVDDLEAPTAIVGRWIALGVSAGAAIWVAT